MLKVNAKEHYFIGFRHRMSSVARHLKVFDFPRRMNEQVRRASSGVEMERLFDDGRIRLGEERPIGIDLGRKEKILQ